MQFKCNLIQYRKEQNINIIQEYIVKIIIVVNKEDNLIKSIKVMFLFELLIVKVIRIFDIKEWKITNISKEFKLKINLYFVILKFFRNCGELRYIHLHY